MSEALQILWVGAGTLLAIVAFAFVVFWLITTHNPRLQRGLVVEEKYLRVANYAMGMNHDIEMIAHSCGVEHPRLLRREHCRIVQNNGHSTSLKTLYPYPAPKAVPAAFAERANMTMAFQVPVTPAAMRADINAD